MDKVIKNKHVVAIAKAVKDDPYDTLIFAGIAYIFATFILIGYML